MNVIFLSPHSDPEATLGEPDAGGQCVYEFQLGQALSKLPDTQVCIFCRDTGQRPILSQVNPNYQIHRIPCGSPGFIMKENIETVIPEFVQKVKLELSGREDLVFHAHYWDGGKAALQLKHVLQPTQPHIPLIWTPHSLGVIKRQKFPGSENELFYNFIPRLCWENYTSLLSQALIVSSKDEKSDVVSQYAINPKKIYVIPPGVDTEGFQRLDQAEARQLLGLPQDKKLLLCLGRITRSKGYEYAIRALATLRTMAKLDVGLVICGGSASNRSTEEEKYLQELRGLAKLLSVDKHVIFRSAIEHHNINQIFSAADVMIMASEHEPFGLTVIESMAMKVPVVASNKGGPADIILHNNTGCLVNIHDHARTAYYIMTLLQDKQFCSQIVEQAYEYVIMEYDWSNKAQLFWEVYAAARKQAERDRFHEVVRDHYFLYHNL